jgi:hypothetical protein
MSNFLEGLDDLVGKQKYQGFMVNLGIDRLEVLIPIKNSSKFQSLAEKQQPVSRKELLTIVNNCEGLLNEDS